MPPLKRLSAALLLASITSLAAWAQAVGSVAYKGHATIENNEVPVLIKHLPDWETVRERSTLAKSTDELKAVLGERPVLDLIDFEGDTEAITAPYDAGKLLIVEYPNAQASIEADARFTAELRVSGDKTVYRRIGNYNAFVFDAADPAAANELLDQVKYEKVVQWLGKNPFRISAERAFVLTTTDIFISTVLAIVIAMGTAIFLGVIAGYVFFLIREQKRAKRNAYTDAGGMTRLNLDGLTSEIAATHLLGE